MNKRVNQQPILATYTLGCKVNQFETRAMEELFEEGGYQLGSFEEYADVYLINTCTVTAMSDKKSRQIIRRAKKQNPQSILAVVGCYSQKSPDEILAIPGVDLVMGTSNRDQIVEEVQKAQAEKSHPVSRSKVQDIMNIREFEPLAIHQLRDKTRAFVKIQEGCDRYCSYCIIPYTRGRVRSQKIADILPQVRDLAAKGVCEIVLTGIHVASYGKDLQGDHLVDLIRQVGEVAGIHRVRTSSVEPVLITREFLEGVRQVPEFCPHFHLSLQSGCDTVLQRMNRRYDTAMYRQAVERIRQVYPRAAITTDVIVGFPGETEAEFQATVDFLKDIHLYEMHIFKFSPREGTPAATMKDQVSGVEKNRRSEILLELTKQQKQEFAQSFIGSEVEVLFESKTKDGYEGHTDNYLTVYLPSTQNLEGKRCQVRITRQKEDVLIGESIV